MKIGLAQINPTVGDINGNCTKILEYIKKKEHTSGSSHKDTFLITGPAIFSHIVHENIDNINYISRTSFSNNVYKFKLYFRN